MTPTISAPPLAGQVVGSAGNGFAVAAMEVPRSVYTSPAQDGKENAGL